MYSIVETGGFQYKVELGMLLKVPSVDAEVGSDLEMKTVLLVANGDDIKIGTPVLEDAVVKAEVLRHDRHDKVVVYKKKRRTRYQRSGNHRQGYTEVLIKEITSGSESITVDANVVERNRARVVALNKAKEVPAKMTRKEKIQAGIPKPAKVKKNQLRKEKEA